MRPKQQQTVHPTFCVGNVVQRHLLAYSHNKVHSAPRGTRVLPGERRRAELCRISRFWERAERADHTRTHWPAAQRTPMDIMSSRRDRIPHGKFHRGVFGRSLVFAITCERPGRRSQPGVSGVADLHAPSLWFQGAVLCMEPVVAETFTVAAETIAHVFSDRARLQVFHLPCAIRYHRIVYRRST